MPFIRSESCFQFHPSAEGGDVELLHGQFRLQSAVKPRPTDPNDHQPDSGTVPQVRDLSGTKLRHPDLARRGRVNRQGPVTLPKCLRDYRPTIEQARVHATVEASFGRVSALALRVPEAEPVRKVRPGPGG